MTKWRLAKSLEILRAQVNAAWPARSKASDGSIGDANHASRASDHNPWVRDGETGVVTAIDITHDPKSGCDSYALAEALRKSRDPRIKYIISNGRIAAGMDGPQPWVWRRYTGANAHAHHVHISVKAEKARYDDARSWSIGAASPPKTAARHVAPLTAGYSADVARVQRALAAMGYHEVGAIDGLVGGRTRGAIAAFLTDRRIPGAANIDPVLLAEIDRASAEPFVRPVAPARAYATANDIAPKVEAVQQNAWSRFWSKLLAVPSTAGAAIWGVVSHIPAANDAASPYIAMGKEYVSSVPGWVWLLVIAAVGFAIWRSTNKSEAAAVAAYQAGRLN